MSLTVDLNSDMGEGFGPWMSGDDEALLDIVTSANIACGMHAGDWDWMARTMARAARNGVGIGAHPGFADLQGFGRRKLSMPHESLANLVRYQVAAAEGMARATGAPMRHVKLHGALANMCAADREMSLACYRAVLSVAPDTTIMVLAGTEQERAVRELGCNAASEIFADRAYNDDATLVDRSLPGAVIHDAEAAATRVVEMVQAGAIITATGKTLPCRIDTVCLHSDTPEAVEMARAVRQRLEAANVTLTAFEGQPIA
ncbi:LamB/YcsF family protein [Litorisediminicola beolgyonensis]|uniref:LamB/YcsF family protein n=1 Tax=Litorisediminicola beolgyonensis TaxID=1173614 RepID=A0ABW3ZMG9_9RHOB